MFSLTTHDTQKNRWIKFESLDILKIWIAILKFDKS